MSKLEVQVDSIEKRMTSIEASVQSATASKKADEDQVKDYVKNVLESKHQMTPKSGQRQYRRKTLKNYRKIWIVLSKWSEKWLLQFNSEKCKVMHIGTVFTR